MGSISLIGKGYIFIDNQPAFRVTDTNYAEAVFKQASKHGLLRGVSSSRSLLDKMTDLLPGKLRRVNDLDVIEFNSAQKSAEQEKVLGKRHVCSACNRKFYDMNRNLSCPICTKSAVVVK